MADPSEMTLAAWSQCIRTLFLLTHYVFVSQISCFLKFFRDGYSISNEKLKMDVMKLTTVDWSSIGREQQILIQ